MFNIYIHHGYLKYNEIKFVFPSLICTFILAQELLSVILETRIISLIDEFSSN